MLTWLNVLTRLVDTVVELVSVLVSGLVVRLSVETVVENAVLVDVCVDVVVVKVTEVVRAVMVVNLVLVTVVSGPPKRRILPPVPTAQPSLALTIETAFISAATDGGEMIVHPVISL